MNHLESAFKGKNNWWRYFFLVILVFLISNTIGSLPLIVSVGIKSVTNPELFAQYISNPNNYSLLGFNKNFLLILMLFPFIAALATFILCVKPVNNRTFKETINGTEKIRWSRFFISGFFWLLLSAIYYFIYLKLNPSNFSINNATKSLIGLSVVSLLLIPFQAAFEEVLFRGYLMQGFAIILKNRWFPLIITSVLFGLMHSINPEVKEFGFLTMMPQYIVFGLIFGVITIMDDGIEASIGAHAVNNAFLCIMVTNKASALQTAAFLEQNTVYPWTEFAGLLVMGIIFVIILKMVFKWGKFSLLFGNLKIEKNIKNQIP